VYKVLNIAVNNYRCLWPLAGARELHKAANNHVPFWQPIPVGVRGLNQRAQFCYIAQRADMAIATGVPMSVFTNRAR